MEKYKILSGASLKNIALFTMLCDHFNKAILIKLCMSDNAPQFLSILSLCLEVLGRIAFPIFVFLLVEGFHHTRSKTKYLRNLIIFALISEIPFNLFSSCELLAPWHQNIFFTLSLGFIIIWLIDELKKKTRYWYIPSVILTVIGCLIALYGSFDYDMYGILTIVLCYCSYNKWYNPLVSYIPLIENPLSILGFITIYFYNGKRGKQNKWFNYLFYPLHLLILGIISSILFY